MLNELENAEEKGYRRGFSHGFTAGVDATSGSYRYYEKTLKEINEWKNKDINECEGAPGTFLQGKIMNAPQELQLKQS